MFNLLLKTNPFDFGAIFGNFFKRWYYYAVLLAVIVAIILFAIFGKKRKNNLSHTQKIVLTAVFSALSFVANFFTIKASDVLQISFVSLVGFVSGYTLGAILGFTASFIGDLICGIVAPFGAYNPIIGIGSGLWGLIPGVVFSFGNRFPKFRFKEYILTIISFLFGFICNSFAVNTFGLSVMYSMTFDSLMILLPWKLLVVLGNAIVSMFIVAFLRRILPKDKFFFEEERSKSCEIE